MRGEFGVVPAAVAGAVAAVGARRTSVVIHAVDAGGGCERIESEFAQAVVGPLAESTAAQAGHRIVVDARRFERIGAAVAGNAVDRLDFFVVRLEFFVSHRPVGDARAGRKCLLAVVLDRARTDLEVVDAISPALARPVGCSADMVVHHDRAHRRRPDFGVRIGSPGRDFVIVLLFRERVEVGIGHQLVVVAQEIGLGAPRTGFEPDDLLAGLGEYVGGGSAGHAQSDDNGINFRECH